MVNIHYSDNIVQSPSSTMIYLSCPLRYVLSLSKHIKPHIPESVAVGNLLHHYMAALNKGNVIYRPTNSDLLQLCLTVSKAIPAKLNAQTQHVELPLGKARLDHVLSSYDYGATESRPLYYIVDYKYYPSLKERDIAQLSRNYLHQMKHCAWALAQDKGLWYSQDDFSIEAIICFLTLKGNDNTATYYNYNLSFNRRLLQKWLDNAFKLWYNMHNIKEGGMKRDIMTLDTAYANEKECEKETGRCWYYHHCHD